MLENKPSLNSKWTVFHCKVRRSKFQAQGNCQLSFRRAKEMTFLSFFRNILKQPEFLTRNCSGNLPNALICHSILHVPHIDSLSYYWGHANVWLSGCEILEGYTQTFQTLVKFQDSKAGMYIISHKTAVHFNLLYFGRHSKLRWTLDLYCSKFCRHLKTDHVYSVNNKYD